LEFMRHGEKEPEGTKPDGELQLTERGREMAQEKGRQLSAQKEVSLTWGSPKKRRTRETVLHAMLPDINKDANPEEIEEIISREQKIGKKFIEDERLDFNFNGPEGKEIDEAFDEETFLRFLVEKSDKRAIELQDKESSTYSRFAGNIAEIISRYSAIGDSFNRIASNKDDYKKFGNQMERYLGTHQGVVEGFVAKVLEKTQGVEKRNEFIDSLGNGFKETEGIRIEVINKGAEQKIIVNLKINGKTESLEINRDLIEDIINERNEFEKHIAVGTEEGIVKS